MTIFFYIISIFALLFIIGTFIYAIAFLFNAKMRLKVYSRQIKTAKDVLEENEDVLKEMQTKEANIVKENIQIKAKAIKDGLASNNFIYCKYCGEKIDEDSTFCKKCGKKQ